jgi:hypothetical protein
MNEIRVLFTFSMKRQENISSDIFQILSNSLYINHCHIILGIKFVAENEC